MNNYKITNEEEHHRDLQYHDGLNEDTIPFNPSGDCLPGGIYYASKDIFAFLHYGPWIRKVTLPEDAQVYQNPGTPVKWKADKVILGPRRKIDLSVLKELVAEGADIHVNNDEVLIWASYNGHLEIVKFLVESGADIHADRDASLKWASKEGHLEVVKFLVESGADIHAENDEALRYASKEGHFKVVKFLESKGKEIKNEQLQNYK